MKNFIFIILILFVFLPLLAGAVAPKAGDLPTFGTVGVPKSPINEPNEFLTVIASVVKYTYAIFFIITVMFILFAAFNYLTGGDEPEKIKTAHQQIKYAAIAIAVALLAVGASTIIKNFLGNSDGATPSAPSEGKGQPWIPSPDYPGGPVST